MKSDSHTSRQRDEPHPTGIVTQVLNFADFLRCRGFKIFQSSILDSLRSLREISMSNRMDFFHALRVNLTSTDLEWVRFADLFEEFFGAEPQNTEEERRPPSTTTEERMDRSSGKTVLEVLGNGPSEAGEQEKERLEGIAYSPVSMVEKKDLCHFDARDVQIAQLAMKRMMDPFHLALSRRLRRSRKHGKVDFRRMMRSGLKGGSIPLELFFREKKKRLKRLVILADVSGSMDRYARFVMPFLLGLRGAGSRAEVFVFSTSLTRITPLVRHLSMEKALERISEEVPDWSGGTRIGYSLHQFNQIHGTQLVNKRAVVVIMSDGWDLGGKQLLEREMTTVSRQAYCVIWLNPLAGDPDYKPVCQGMRIALPYVDHFLPADTLESLRRVGRVLSKVMVH